MTERDPIEKLRRIFHVAPWLKTDGKAIHIPVSGMDAHHQLTWPDLYAILDIIEEMKGNSAHLLHQLGQVRRAHGEEQPR